MKNNINNTKKTKKLFSAGIYESVGTAKDCMPRKCVSVKQEQYKTLGKDYMEVLYTLEGSFQPKIGTRPQEYMQMVNCYVGGVIYHN